MLKFCFAGNVFSPTGQFVASGTNLLTHQAVKQMEGISELLPEEDVQNPCMRGRLYGEVWIHIYRN